MTVTIVVPTEGLNWQEAKRLVCERYKGAYVRYDDTGVCIACWDGDGYVKRLSESLSDANASDPKLWLDAYSRLPPADAVQEPAVQPLDELPPPRIWATVPNGNEPGDGRTHLIVVPVADYDEALRLKVMFESTVASQASEMAALRERAEVAIHAMNALGGICRELRERAETAEAERDAATFIDSYRSLRDDNRRLRDALTKVRRRTGNPHVIALVDAALQPIEAGKEGK